MSTTTEREPLLSDEEINGADGVMTPGPDSVYKLERKRYLFRLTPEDVRDFYEGLIDRGELVKPKTARIILDRDGARCEACNQPVFNDNTPEVGQYHTCGARIIE